MKAKYLFNSLMRSRRRAYKITLFDTEKETGSWLQIKPLSATLTLTHLAWGKKEILLLSRPFKLWLRCLSRIGSLNLDVNPFKKRIFLNINFETTLFSSLRKEKKCLWRTMIAYVLIRCIIKTKQNVSQFGSWDQWTMWIRFEFPRM